MDSVDVRSPETVPQFEDMLSAGPITIVLVYADWCGHCTRFKENIWSKLIGLPNRKANLASVHYDQLENTSQKNASIKGYPSVLVIGTDKKAATFPDGSKKTNAFPKAQDLETMEEMVTKNAGKILSAPKFVEDVEPRKQEMSGGGTSKQLHTSKRKGDAVKTGGLMEAITNFIRDGTFTGRTLKRKFHTSKKIGGGRRGVSRRHRRTHKKLMGRA